ncbi:DUF3291 domain-containing protein [Streptomyces hydrogenans]|uniref:DUF3291 domain-containing protein n=1 Tax=Streptomyces hydrogenans TaxID=1873719 RepID=UPI0037F3767C
MTIGPDLPTLAGRAQLFWTTPTWADACARLEHLHDHGPSPFAFSFRRPFDADGAPTRLGPAERRGTGA